MSFNKLSDTPQSGAIESLDERSIIGQDRRAPKKISMNVLEYMERYGHEQLSVSTDKDTGLRAFIAIHDTTLGPGLGGVRVSPHATEDEAVMDALRLSRPMTYKSAAAGLDLGGGKGLIIEDSRAYKTKALMRAFGRFVDTLGGRYITTEDVGTSLDDLEWIADETAHVNGLPLSRGGSGETSEMTGWGVYRGLKACAKEVWRNDSLSGKSIAIQGFGHTATFLTRHLLEKEEGGKAYRHRPERGGDERCAGVGRGGDREPQRHPRCRVRHILAKRPGRRAERGDHHQTEVRDCVRLRQQPAPQ